MAPKEFSIPEIKEQSGLRDEVLSVEEKIILEKQYVGYPKEPVGPSIRLFFHELTNKDSVSTRIFSKVTAGILFVLFIVLYPFIAFAIKLSSTGPVIIRQTCTGFRGHPFQRYLFRTTMQDTEYADNSNQQGNTFFIGRILKAVRLDELPSVINILRNEMKLVGPKIRPYSLDTYWNNRFSEYYKRFATDPGLIGVSREYKVECTEDTQKAQYTLKKELKYLLNPTLSRDLKILIKAFSTPLRRSAQRV